MARGPMPVDASASSGSGGPGVMFWLNVAYKALPPMARLALAQQVKAWAEQAEQDARGDMRPRPSASDFDRPGVHDTTGETR